MNNLNELGLKYNADKSSKGHNYLQIYEKYFQSFIDKSIKLLEIGVCEGNSLRVWNDYFNNAQIYGIDIIKHDTVTENENVHFLLGDQTDIGFLEKINQTYGPFDIVIDDGSHIPGDQITSLMTLFPIINNDGIYIIEDVHTSYWNDYGGSDSFIDFAKELLNDINFHGKYKGNTHDCGNPEACLKNIQQLNDFEKYLKSIHFYTSLIFLLRR